MMLLKLIDMSAAAAFIILAVMIVRAIFKRIPKKYICILWGLAAIKLVCPVSPESTFSLVPRVNYSAWEIITGDIVYTLNFS